MLRFYGTTQYNAPGMGNILISDITKFATIAQRYKASKYRLPYTIREGERPEQIALRLYGSESLWYMVYLYNGMDDPMNQWPMTQQELQQYIADKWPDDPPGAIHHYVDQYGVIQSPLSIAKLRGISVQSAIALENLTPVTIQEYEQQENDKRKQIFLLDPDWVGPVERELRNEFRTPGSRIS